MLISVIMPVYNGESYVSRSVKSYIDQTYQEREIILYDNASTDNSWEVLQQLAKQYPGIVRIYREDINLGPGGAKTKGIQHARGEYIHFADCDDYVSPEHLEQLVKAVKLYDYPDIVIGGYTAVDEHGKYLYQRRFKKIESALYRKFSNWANLYRLDYIQEKQLYIPSGRIIDDVLFQTANILSHPSVGVCGECGYFYVQNTKSASNTELKRFVPGALEQEFRYLAELKEKTVDDDDRELLTYYAFRCVCWHLLKGGCKIGSETMQKEYDAAIALLERYFPNFESCHYISWFRPQYERGILRFVVGTIIKLYRLGLAGLFFKIYSRIDLSCMWPQM